MDGIVEQVKSLASTADDATYRKLIDTLRLLCVAIERPEDTAHRITFSSFQCCAAKVAIDFKIVDYLVEDNGKPKNVSDLAVKTGLQPLLLGRLLRYMATVGMVHEVSWDTFEASNVTKALAMSGIQGGIGFGYDIVNISAQGLVEYLEKNPHSDIDDIANCPWQFGAKSNETVFQYLFSHPKSLQSFNLWMTHQRLGNKSFLDVYPLSDQFTNMKDSDNNHNDPWVLFVDIGGGVGHVCDVVRQRCPELAHGRVIVQDLPATIAQASAKSDVEAMVHDYFTPQPVKGAKFYYLRNIMHNLADKDCLRILEQTRPALAKDSVILIDDLVVPARGAHWRATELDMLMMCALGAIERTEKQWNDLLDKAGFKILGSYCYDEVQQDTVLAVVPVDR